MPDFVVSTAFKSKDYITKAFGSMSRGADKFGGHADRAFRSASRSGLKLNTVLKGIVAGSLAYKGFSYLKEGVSGIVAEAAKLENATTDFKTLTGSMKAAVSVVSDLRKTAASTPFEFGDLSTATKTLMGFGAVTKESLIPTLRMLGDTAGGSAERLDRIVLAYSQSIAGGKANMQDVNQLINNGVPILGTLAKMWKVNTAQARDMISEGRATGEVVTEAFKRMTSSGGMFYQGMENASKTLTGKWSTFTDNVKIAAATFGTALLPQIKTGVDLAIQIAKRVNDWSQANSGLIRQGFDKFIGALSSGFKAAVPIVSGAVKAVGALYNTMKPFIPLIPVVVGGMLAYSAALKIERFFLFVRFLKSAAIAQGVLNAVMMINPIGAIVAGVTALVGVGVLLYKHWDKVVGVFKRLWKAFDSPVLQGIAVAFAPFIGIPALIIKQWEPIKDLFTGLIDKVSGFAEKFGILRLFGLGSEEDVDRKGDRLAGEVPPNRAEIERQGMNFYNARLDIAGAPEGSKLSTTKSVGAPQIRMELLGAN